MPLFQVHGLDAETWKKVDVVYIDIADRTQVEPKVMIRKIFFLEFRSEPCPPRPPVHVVRWTFFV